MKQYDTAILTSAKVLGCGPRTSRVGLCWYRVATIILSAKRI